MTKREAWILRGFLALGAALTALTLIFPQVGMLEWVTMIPIALALYRLTDRGVSLWKAYRYGFFTVFVFYFILYHWFVYLYPLDFVGLGNGASVAVVIAGWLGLSNGIRLQNRFFSRRSGLCLSGPQLWHGREFRGGGSALGR